MNGQVEYKSEARKENIIKGKKYRFSLITKKLIRFEFSENGQFEDRPTQTILSRDLGEVDYEILEDDHKLEIITDSLHLHYIKEKAFSANSLYIDVKYNFSAYNNRWYYGEDIQTLKGTLRTLDEIDGEAPLEEGLISKQGFSVLDDSQSFLLDQEHHPLQRDIDQFDGYFFAYGRDYQEALTDFYKMSGQPPLLPRYALGNWWSRYWKYSEDSYKKLIKRFKEENVPLSVSVIDMDWHLTDIPARFGSGWTGYTWNKELFPDPKRLINWLHDEGLTVTLNVHPADGIRAFEEQYPIVAKKLGLNREVEEPAIFDLMDEAFRETYFTDVHHPIEEQGVDFWWIDWQQGEESSSGVDPLWLLNHYHYHDIQRKGKNDVILSRYSGPGSHRYPIGFSGDTVTTWKSLQFQPYLTSASSNIGYTWWSHDIGGHFHGYRDEELTLRWVQFGVFSPINRLHSSASAFSSKEPWEQNDVVKKSMIEFLQLRHAFLPYLYTMNSLTNEKSLPLIRPMYYEYPHQEEAYDRKNQYLFGTELMVAPITTKSDKQTLQGSEVVYFPSGDWFDIFSNNRYKGETTLRVYRDITEMPVFAKEGAILPMDAQPTETKANELPEEIEWFIYPGKSNSFELVEDKDNKRVRTTVTIDQEQQEVCIKVSGDKHILPKNRTHTLVFNASEKVSLNDQEGASLNPIDYNQKLHRTSFSIDSYNGEEKVYTFNEFTKIKDQEVASQLFKRLYKAQVSYDLKDKLWKIIQEKKSDMSFISLLNELNEEALSESLFELMYVKMSD